MSLRVFDSGVFQVYSEVLANICGGIEGVSSAKGIGSGIFPPAF